MEYLAQMHLSIAESSCFKLIIDANLSLPVRSFRGIWSECRLLFQVPGLESLIVCGIASCILDVLSGLVLCGCCIGEQNIVEVTERKNEQDWVGTRREKPAWSWFSTLLISNTHPFKIYPISILFKNSYSIGWILNQPYVACFISGYYLFFFYIRKLIIPAINKLMTLSRPYSQLL